MVVSKAHETFEDRLESTLAFLAECRVREAAPKPAAVAAHEKDLEELRGEHSRLDAKLSTEIRPQLALALQTSAELEERIARLKTSLEQLPLLRKEAQERFGKLTRRQLSEIKQLARRPPDCIRRTLSAAWLLLNMDRFGGQSTFQFNEEKDWHRCQQMLGEESFVTGVLEFDPACLSASPQIPQYVATVYLGMKGVDLGVAQETPADASPQQQQHRLAGGGAQPRQQAATPKGESKQPALKGVRSQVALHTSVSKAALPKPPLEVGGVTRASEPCGTLLVWMQRLLAEGQERSRLLRELAATEAEQQAEEQRRRALEGESAQAEGALAALLERERELRRHAPAAPLSPVRRPCSAAKQGRPVSSGRPGSSGLRKRVVRRCGEQLPPVRPITPGAPSGLAPGAPSGRVSPVASPRPAAAQAHQRQQMPSMLAPLRAPPMPKVELDVTGRLKSVKDRLAKNQVTFSKNSADILRDSPSVEALQRIAVALEEHRGRLKVVLEGFADHGEEDGIDEMRGNAVARWLMNTVGVAAGLLRVKGRRHAGAGGRRVVPRPMQELVPLYGPISPKLASFCSRVGLYFEENKADLTPETALILMEMAAWLKGEKSVALVEGHCDKAEFHTLAMNRARAVSDELVKLGVVPKRLRSETRMSELPLSRLHSAPNRRVELYLE